MFSGLIFALVVSAPPTPVGSISQTELSTPRKLFEISRDVTELVRREARAQIEVERVAVAVDMATLYREIKRDPRLPTSDSLKEFKGRLWGKLTEIKKDAQAKIKREARRKTLEPRLNDEQVLASADDEIVVRALTEQLSLIGATTGGPAGVFGQVSMAGGAGGGLGPSDYGPALVDLIERTIAPEFWDVNGGPGTIIYYRPLMCLVVRATSEIHHQIGGTLGAVRAAGR